MVDNFFSKLNSNLLFKDVDIENIESLFDFSRISHHKEGEIIFSKGSDAKSIFLVLHGKVNYIDYNFINRGSSSKSQNIIQDDQFFGYDDLIDKKRRSSTAIAIEDSDLLEITNSELERLISRDVRILKNLSMDLLAQRNELYSNKNHNTTMYTNPDYNFYNSQNPSPMQSTKVFQGRMDKIDLSENEINEMKLALEREKQFAEEAIQQEMEEITKKEEELKKLEENLNKEKEVSALSLSKEVEQLQLKEDNIKALELKIAAQKENAKQGISRKLEFIKQKEIDIEKKIRSIEAEKKVLDEAMAKAKDLAQKEIELMQFSKQLENSKQEVERILNKESELQLKEKELEEKFTALEKEKNERDALKQVELETIELELNKKREEFQNEKSILEEAKIKMDELLAKEKELNTKAESLEKEKHFSEEMLENEFRQLEERENLIAAKEKELEKREVQILKAKEKERELERREEELNRKLELLTREEVDNNSLSYKEEELRKKELELIEKEKALEKEKLFAEQSLQEELDSIQQKEQELKSIGEKIESEKNKLEKDLRVKLAQLQARESELIIKEEELSKAINDSKKIADEEIKKREREIAEERNQIRSQSLDTIKDIEEQLNDFKLREHVLLQRIESLEQEKLSIITERKSSGKDSFMHDEPNLNEPFYKGNQFQTDIISKSDSIPESKKPKSVDVSPTFSDDDIVFISDDGETVIRREFAKTYQEFEVKDVKVIVVNLQRGTTNYATELQGFLTEKIKAGSRKFIIDLSFCLFFDSTFLGVLVRNLKIISYEGGDLALVLNIKKMASTTFFLAGMDRIFKIFDSIESALKIFNKKD